MVHPVLYIDVKLFKNSRAFSLLLPISTFPLTHITLYSHRRSVYSIVRFEATAYGNESFCVIAKYIPPSHSDRCVIRIVKVRSDSLRRKRGKEGGKNENGKIDRVSYVSVASPCNFAILKPSKVLRSCSTQDEFPRAT